MDYILATLAYPYLRSEFFLPWENHRVGDAVHRVIDIMIELQLLESNPSRGTLNRPSVASLRGAQLMTLAQSVIHTFERFYIAVALLLKEGSGKLNQAELEHRCQLMAQRISQLYELNAPEFFDKSLFRNFIQTLKTMGILSQDAHQRLIFDDSLQRGYDDAKVLLSEQVRHSVLQAAQGALASGALLGEPRTSASLAKTPSER